MYYYHKHSFIPNHYMTFQKYIGLLLCFFLYLEFNNTHCIVDLILLVELPAYDLLQHVVFFHFFESFLLRFNFPNRYFQWQIYSI